MFSIFVDYFWKLFTFCYLRLKGVELELGGVKIYGLPLILKAKGSRIILRSGTTLISDSKYNPAGINHRVILATMASNSIIEIDGAGLSGSSIVCVKSVYVGRGSGLGANSNIYDTDFHLVDPRLRSKQTNISTAKSDKVYIGKNVWISSNVNILKGVLIGDNSVVGCGAVVTSNVDDGCFYAGIPAVKVKKIS